MSDLYDHPEAYELAYSFRDIRAECDFLVDATVRAAGRRPAVAAELAAGPALHARELAGRGVRAYAVDRSNGALAYLARVAPAVAGVQGDLRDFRLPEPADLVFCPLGSFAYLLTDDDWLAALGAAADALTRHGALVLEFVLDDANRGEAAAWTVEDGSRRVSVSAGPSVREGEGVYTWELRLDYEGPDGRQALAGVQRQRVVTPALVQRLLLASRRFERIDSFADYDLRRRWRGESTLVVAARRS